MKRFHVHLNVADLGRTVQFYQTLFGAAPDKLRDDYAQWMLDDPAVNFAVSTQKCCDGDGGGVSHLGFQVEDDAGLAEITRALTDAEQAIFEEQEISAATPRATRPGRPTQTAWCGRPSTGWATPRPWAGTRRATRRSRICTNGR